MTVGFRIVGVASANLAGTEIVEGLKSEVKGVPGGRGLIVVAVKFEAGADAEAVNVLEEGGPKMNFCIGGAIVDEVDEFEVAGPREVC